MSLASVLVASSLLMASGRAVAAEEAEALDCMECHSDPELTMEDEFGDEVSIHVDMAQIQASAHATNTCASCHRDIQSTHPDDEVAAEPVACTRCHEAQSESYEGSVHGLALESGDEAAPLCTDCHGTHQISHPSEPSSPLFWSNLMTTCGDCHPDIAEEVRQSIHGQAITQNIREAPSCIDCHFEHRIEGLKSASSLKIARQVCSRCHASERMNIKYGLPGRRVATFFESYHGLAVEFGSTTAADCSSCHGYHLILPSTDPRSSIHPDRLVGTCGECHPGAGENFAMSRIHLDGSAADDYGGRVNRWVRRVYWVLISIVVGSMVLHNLLLWLRQALAMRRAEGRTVERMNRGQRWQHLLLVLSFLVLVVSGFALEYPHSWLAWLSGADETVRRTVHRVAAVVLLLLGAYHLVYLMATREGRQLAKDLRPRLKDLTDMSGNVRYLTGFGSRRPRFGRFGYPEKIEYWAVFWGTVIMGTTGLMLWFKIEVTQFLPRWILDVAKTVHYYEAILAILAIVVWHFYHVIFDPAIYPMNWAWWDGMTRPEERESEAEATVEHPSPKQR